MPASDKLFYWLFQEEPDRILQLLPDLPTLILEAQMAADPRFLRRLYAESALLQALALLLQSETRLPASSAAIRARAPGTAQEGAIRDVIAAILIERF